MHSLGSTAIIKRPPFRAVFCRCLFFFFLYLRTVRGAFLAAPLAGPVPRLARAVLAAIAFIRIHMKRLVDNYHNRLTVLLSVKRDLLGTGGVGGDLVGLKTLTSFIGLRKIKAPRAGPFGCASKLVR